VRVSSPSKERGRGEGQRPSSITAISLCSTPSIFPNTSLFQNLTTRYPSISRYRVPCVFADALRMLAAVDLNNQSLGHAGEVCDIRADGDLTPELMAAESAITKVIPELLLGISEGAAQCAGLVASLHERFLPCSNVVDPHPRSARPLPPGRGEESTFHLFLRPDGEAKSLSFPLFFLPLSLRERAG
jgi:hypothetical protein